MRDEHGYAPQRVSRRDIAAVWICCAIAAVAGALVVGSANTDAARRETYSGVYLPGRDVVSALDRRDDDLDDETGRDEVFAQDPPRFQLCETQEKRLHAAAEMPPNNTMSPLKC